MVLGPYSPLAALQNHSGRQAHFLSFSSLSLPLQSWLFLFVPSVPSLWALLMILRCRLAVCPHPDHVLTLALRPASLSSGNALSLPPGQARCCVYCESHSCPQRNLIPQILEFATLLCHLISNNRGLALDGSLLGACHPFFWGGGPPDRTEHLCGPCRLSFVFVCVDQVHGRCVMKLVTRLRPSSPRSDFRGIGKLV